MDIKLKCISESIRDKLVDIIKEGDESIKPLVSKIKKAPSCESQPERKKTARSEFMGQCMRSTEKGGQGKGMKECSDVYKTAKGEKKNDEPR